MIVDIGQEQLSRWFVALDNNKRLEKEGSDGDLLPRFFGEDRCNFFFLLTTGPCTLCGETRTT
jgi:hypothetical protein